MKLFLTLIALCYAMVGCSTKPNIRTITKVVYEECPKHEYIPLEYTIDRNTTIDIKYNIIKINDNNTTINVVKLDDYYNLVDILIDVIGDKKKLIAIVDAIEQYNLIFFKGKK